MPLSDDQRAMLRLLAQREEGYEDIAALMGLSVDEVRAKVREALAELDQGTGGAPAPRPERAAEPRPVARAPAEPKPAAAKPSPKPAGPRQASRASRPSIPSLPKDQGALRGLIAGGAVVLVIVILLVTGVFGGGDDGSGSTTSSGEATAGEATAGEAGIPATGGKEPTQAVLRPVDGSDASGRALFGRAGKNVVLLLSARNLDASPEGQSYTVSLSRSPSARLPLVATKVSDQGVISGRFRVAPQVLGLLAGGFDTMELSLVPDDELRVALAQARKSRQAPDYGGEEVLEGPVTGPIVDAGAGG
jgi:hypothetical protein